MSGDRTTINLHAWAPRIADGTPIVLECNDHGAAFAVPAGRAATAATIVGLATGGVQDDNGSVSVVTNGVLDLSIEQWSAIVAGELDAGQGLHPGSAYYATSDGRLTRIPLGGGTEVGVAISRTQMRVQIQPPPRIEPWLAAIQIATPGVQRQRVILRDLAGLAEIAGIWRGKVHVGQASVHDEVTYDVVQALAICDRASDRVLLFLEVSAEVSEDDSARVGCSTCNEIYALSVATWREIDAPMLTPVDPPLTVNFVHRATGWSHEREWGRETDVLQAIDERTNRCVLMIGTDDVAGQHPSFECAWDPDGLPEV